MPISPKLYQELIEKHEEAHRAAKSDTFRDLLMTCGHLAFWVACGLALLGMALHTTDPSWGSIFWKAVGSSRVDLQACKLEYSIVSPK